MSKRANLPTGDDDTERSRIHADNEVDWFFENASPNPDRVGCPPAGVLEELARKERPISDPAFRHLEQCSPCYQQFRRLQGEGLVSSHATRRGRRLLAVAAGLLILLAAGIVGWFLQTGGVEPEYALSPQPQLALLDLRMLAVTRGEALPQQPTIKLSRSAIEFNIILPVGYEPGQYDLQLINGSVVIDLVNGAEASLENHILTIRAAANLKELASGNYRLALRRRGDDWRFFPITLE